MTTTNALPVVFTTKDRPDTQECATIAFGRCFIGFHAGSARPEFDFMRDWALVGQVAAHRTGPLFDVYAPVASTREEVQARLVEWDSTVGRARHKECAAKELAEWKALEQINDSTDE